MSKTSVNILKGLEIGEAKKKLSERYVLSTQFVKTDRSTGRPSGIYVFVRPGGGCVVMETGKGNIVTDVSVREWWNGRGRYEGEAEHPKSVERYEVERHRKTVTWGKEHIYRKIQEKPSKESGK